MKITRNSDIQEVASIVCDRLLKEGIEAVLSVLAIKNNLVYPTLNYAHQMTELGFTPAKQLITNKTINHVLSNSFGFGGNTSSLIFSRN